MNPKTLSTIWILWILFVAIAFILGLVVFSRFVPALA